MVLLGRLSVAAVLAAGVKGVHAASNGNGGGAPTPASQRGVKGAHDDSNGHGGGAPTPASQRGVKGANDDSNGHGARAPTPAPQPGVEGAHDDSNGHGAQAPMPARRHAPGAATDVDLVGGRGATGSRSASVSKESSGYHKKNSMFAYHKDLLPMDSMDCVTLVLSMVGLVIAAGGGIGGGGILVPLFMIFLRFRPKHAIALSNLTILGGSISNTFFNVQKRRPDGRSIIDWDIIVMMEPSTIAGAVLGSFASKYLPDFVLTVSLCIVLALLAWRTLEKGIKMYAKENENSKQIEPEEKALPSYREGNQVEEDPESSGLLLRDDNEPLPMNDSAPFGKIILLTACFLGCVVMTVLKGSGHGSIMGVRCGSLSFWVLSLSSVPWVILFGGIFRYMLISEYSAKQTANYEFGQEEIVWDSKSTIKYPALCTIAGVFAGLFGVGGGIVKGPLMLEMGVNPQVAAATAATMILFTTTAGCVSFAIFGLLEPNYGVAGFLLGIACTAVGQFGFNTWMKIGQRQSPPVLSIGVVMALSTVLVGLEAMEKLRLEDTAELFAPSSICSKHD